MPIVCTFLMFLKKKYFGWSRPCCLKGFHFASNTLSCLSLTWTSSKDRTWPENREKRICANSVGKLHMVVLS